MPKKRRRIKISRNMFQLCSLFLKRHFRMEAVQDPDNMDLFIYGFLFYRSIEVEFRGKQDFLLKPLLHAGEAKI